MTFVIYGVGAIGGTLAAKLTDAGEAVTGIARGAQLEAIKSGGLLLRTPAGETRASFPCVADPSEIDFAPDDVIFLCMKSQDTLPALARLVAAGVRNQAIVCAQNGVANEREALRFFPNVYAMMVVLPATFIRPGEVAAFGAPRAGILDIGRYPGGRDATVDRLCTVLEAAGFATYPSADAMRSKYGKLLANLANVLDAATGGDAVSTELFAAARAEGEAVLTAAGIAIGDGGPDDPRRKQLMQMQPVPGAERVGSSTAQSLVRGTGSIETDYLNGEIVLLGRLYGLPTPVNDGFCRLGRKLIADNVQPGSLSLSDVTALIGPAAT